MKRAGISKEGKDLKGIYHLVLADIRLLEAEILKCGRITRLLFTWHSCLFTRRCDATCLPHPPVSETSTVKRVTTKAEEISAESSNSMWRSYAG